MGKYVYVNYARWNDSAFMMSPEQQEQWWIKHKELCKKHGIKFVSHGDVIGVDYHSCFIYETDKPLDGFAEFQGERRRIDDKRYVGMTQTITIISSERA